MVGRGALTLSHCAGLVGRGALTLSHCTGVVGRGALVVCMAISSVLVLGWSVCSLTVTSSTQTFTVASEPKKGVRQGWKLVVLAVLCPYASF